MQNAEQTLWKANSKILRSKNASTMWQHCAISTTLASTLPRITVNKETITTGKLKKAVFGMDTSFSISFHYELNKKISKLNMQYAALWSNSRDKNRMNEHLNISMNKWKSFLVHAMGPFRDCNSVLLFGSFSREITNGPNGNVSPCTKRQLKANRSCRSKSV